MVFIFRPRQGEVQGHSVWRHESTSLHDQPPRRAEQLLHHRVSRRSQHPNHRIRFSADEKQNQERGPLLDFIEAVSTLYPRDLSSVITMFSTNMPSATPNRNPMNPMNPSENSLGSYRSTCIVDSSLARSEHPLPLSDDGLSCAPLQRPALPGLHRLRGESCSLYCVLTGS